MILPQKVNIRIGGTNMKYYKSIGFNYIKGGDIIKIDADKLQSGSNVKIDVKCEICGEEYNIFNNKYHINVKRYGFYSCRKCSKIKRDKTVKKLYGVNNVSQLKVVKEKKKISTNEHYGVDNPSQSQVINKKKQKTMNINYGANTVFESPILYDKIRKIKLEKYGYEYFNNSDKQKLTVLNKYGVENISQLDSVKEKKKQTCLKNYGVEHPAQNIDIFEKQQKSSFTFHKFNNTDIYYQGSYELDFLNKYYNIIKIEKPISILYYYENEKHYYHPDFIIKEMNLIIEIKSDYTYYKEFYKNHAKMNASTKNGYNFIFIINKSYDEFNDFIKSYI